MSLDKDVEKVEEETIRKYRDYIKTATFISS
jgi:hypothetical protein